LAEITNPSVIAKLPAGENQVQIPVDHDDAVQILYIQAASDSLAQRATFAVMAEMLSAPFYNSLRTEKQLGYVVSAFASHFGPVPGLAMLAQSPVADEEQLRQEFLQFLEDYRADVSELAAEDLERYQASLLGRLEEKPKNLSEMNSRFLTSLGLGYDGVDFREQLAAAIRGVTVESLPLAYGDMILSNPRALWLKTAGPGEPNTVIDLRDGGEIYSYDF
jgi:secreted Zn-dependent insulinase-like peptidase